MEGEESASSVFAVSKMQAMILPELDLYEQTS